MVNPIRINGKEVYSDKVLRTINGAKITFSDGSWCDVESGQVVNNGPGYINIGSPSEETGKKETKEKSFTAHTLDVNNISADVDIQVTGGNKITVKVEGPASKINDIDFIEQEDTVFVKGKCESSTSGISIVSGRGSISIGGNCSGSIMSGGNISIGGCHISSSNISIGSGSELESDTKITVNVPKGTSVIISKVCGQVDTGDIEGSLQASVAGSGKINAGRMKDAILNVQGSGKIFTQEVVGNLTAQVSGSGKILVKKGMVPMLNANISGSGKVRFGGNAENASLNVSGSGSITATYIKNRPVTNIAGSGDIDVDNW